MGHSPAAKTATHKKIVTIAARRLRQQGLDGLALADVMKEAGLTMGGFYKHFESRDHLVVEALAEAFGSWRRNANAAAAGGPRFTYSKLVDDYLSESHRDNPGGGCPVSALAGDLARTSPPARALITTKIQEDLNTLGALFKTTEAAARSKAVFTYCALAGAIAMSRAVSDPALSREILRTVAARLKALPES